MASIGFVSFLLSPQHDRPDPRWCFLYSRVFSFLFLSFLQFLEEQSSVKCIILVKLTHLEPRAKAKKQFPSEKVLLTLWAICLKRQSKTKAHYFLQTRVSSVEVKTGSRNSLRMNFKNTTIKPTLFLSSGMNQDVVNNLKLKAEKGRLWFQGQSGILPPHQNQASNDSVVVYI